MPTIEVKKALADIKSWEFVARGPVPPVITGADGTVKYGTIGHVEYKGLDEDGNPAGNAYFFHDDCSDEFKADLIAVLLKHLPLQAAEIPATFDMTPTPYTE